MVNARAISEFAWAIENLLNRILDGTLQRSPAVLRDAARGDRVVAAAGRGAGIRRTAGAPTCRALAARAHALASGRDRTRAAGRDRPLPPRHAPADGARSADADAAAAHVAGISDAAADTGSPSAAPPTAPRASVLAESAAAARQRRDVEPRTPEHRSPIRRCARSTRARPPATSAPCAPGWRASGAWAAPHVLPEEVYRACHTLVGSSTMAEARHGIRLAEPMNHWLRKSFDSGVGLDDSDLLLLGRMHDGDGSGGRPSR